MKTFDKIYHYLIDVRYNDLREKIDAIMDVNNLTNTPKHNPCDEFTIASHMDTIIDQEIVANDIDKFIILQAIVDE